MSTRIFRARAAQKYLQLALLSMLLALLWMCWFWILPPWILLWSTRRHGTSEVRRQDGIHECRLPLQGHRGSGPKPTSDGHRTFESGSSTDERDSIGQGPINCMQAPSVAGYLRKDCSTGWSSSEGLILLVGVFMF